MRELTGQVALWWVAGWNWRPRAWGVGRGACTFERSHTGKWIREDENCERKRAERRKEREMEKREIERARKKKKVKEIYIERKR